MNSALMKAVELILSQNAELMNIMSVTARMSLQSSVIALLIGLPIGIWLGACRFPGRSVLLVANRTLMGMPPVVCGLLFYMLFSGVGPFRHLKLLFTVEIMVMAQVVLITPIVVGNMETYVAGVAPPSGRRRGDWALGALRPFYFFATSACIPLSRPTCWPLPGPSPRCAPCPWWAAPSHGRPT